MTTDRGAIRSCAGTNPAPDANGSTSEVAPNPALTVGPNNDRTPEQKPGFTANDAQGAHSHPPAAPRPEARTGEAAKRLTKENRDNALAAARRALAGYRQPLTDNDPMVRAFGIMLDLAERLGSDYAAVERERDALCDALDSIAGVIGCKAYSNTADADLIVTVVSGQWEEFTRLIDEARRERDEARRALDWMQLVMTPNNWGGDGPHEVYLAGLRNGPADAEAFQVELRSAGGKIQWSVNGATLLDAIKAAMDEDARREAFAE